MQRQEVKLRAFSGADMEWLVDAHARHYAVSDGFDETFGALVARILTAYLRDYDQTCEAGWVAESAGNRVGSIFCVRGDAQGVAKLRLFLVMPEARGTGLGKLLLETCMQFARDRGYREMRLWTHESHAAACALYQAFGWSLISSKPVTSFGVDLVEQSWKITL